MSSFTDRVIGAKPLLPGGGKASTEPALGKGHGTKGCCALSAEILDSELSAEILDCSIIRYSNFHFDELFLGWSSFKFIFAPYLFGGANFNIRIILFLTPARPFQTLLIQTFCQPRGPTKAADNDFPKSLSPAGPYKNCNR